MALLKIKIKAKVLITWGNANLTFIRSTNATKDTSITYSNAVGQTFTAGQILYTSGTQGQPGFIRVTSKDNTTLNGSGVFNISVEHYPTSNEGNKTINYNIDEAPTSISLTYNSLPENNDVIVETNNRTDYIFKVTDFSTKYSDFDNDALGAIAVEGDVTGFKLNGSDYIAGTWVTVGNLSDDLFVYHPLDQSAYYEKDVTWKAKDAQGNVSN